MKRFVDLRHRPRIAVLLACVHEHMDCVQSAQALDDGPRHPIEHDESFLAVLDALARNNEDLRIKLRHFHFVVPRESAHFLLSQSRVHLEERPMPPVTSAPTSNAWHRP